MGFVMDDRGVIVRCAACGSSNRLLYAALGRQTRCGHCKAQLDPPAAPIEVSSTQAFDAAARSSALPLIVDFWAPWCGPCRMVAPELEKVALARAGRTLIMKVNTDEQAELAARYRIRSIPTLAVFHAAREVARLSGARPAADIERFIEDATAEEATRA